MLPWDALEKTLGGKFRNGFTAGTGGQENKSALLHGLKKELQRLGSFDAGIGVLDNDDIVGRVATVLRAVCQAHNRIVGDDELPFLELLQAGIDRAGIAMNEKDAKRTVSVKRVVLWAHAL